jgi:hypothetical protein
MIMRVDVYFEVLPYGDKPIGLKAKSELIKKVRSDISSTYSNSSPDDLRFKAKLLTEKETIERVHHMFDKKN